MIVLGIDTAIRSTGYGILEVDNDRVEVLDYGIIKNLQKLSHSDCLRRLACGIRELIKGYKPNVASIEGIFYGKNVKTALILGYARGCVITVLAENDIPTYTYSPKEVKLGVTGYGNASKFQVASIMSNILSLDITQINDDATDALALAFCHAQKKALDGFSDMNQKKV